MATVVDKKEEETSPDVSPAPLTQGAHDNSPPSNDSYQSLQSESTDGDTSGSSKDSVSSLAKLMARTGCSIVQQNGQRRYGPPEDWSSSVPKRGCEVFVGKIPRDCFEDELVPIFERAGKIYEIRLMMDYNGQNRGYAFVVYSKPSEAKECVRILNNFEIRKVSRLEGDLNECTFLVKSHKHGGGHGMVCRCRADAECMSL